MTKEKEPMATVFFANSEKGFAKQLSGEELEILSTELKFAWEDHVDSGGSEENTTVVVIQNTTQPKVNSKLGETISVIKMRGLVISNDDEALSKLAQWVVEPNMGVMKNEG